MSAVEGWKTGHLGELCSIEIGGTPSRNVPEYWDESKESGNLWVSIKDLNTRVVTDTAEQITEAGIKHSNVKRQETGTVLLSFKLTIGKVAFAGAPLYTNEAIAALCSDELDLDFLFQGLQQWDLLQGVDQAIKGVTLNKGKLKKIEFEYPSAKPEQTIIAEVLSTVDRVIEQTEVLLAKQQRIKTGLMQDLLNRGIDEHGNLRSEATHKFKDSPLGRIPVEWEPSNLGKLAVFLSGYAFKNHELSEHGWRVVRISNLHKPDFPYWHYDGKVKTSWIIREGDVLFSWAGVASSIDCIRYSGPDALMNQHIYNFKFASKNLKTYVYYFLQSYLPVLRTEIEGGAGQLHLTKAKIQSISIPRLEEDELERTVQILEKQQETLDEYHKQLSKFHSLKTALMQDLLTGEKRVTPLLEAGAH